MRNRFHSICPYFAMFPESFAEHWISRLSKPGDTVLDPFCGRGTTPTVAILSDRRAIAVDVNHVAYCLTRAKTAAPTLDTVLRRLDVLEREFDCSEWAAERRRLPPFFRHAFTPRVRSTLLYLRERLQWRTVRSDAFIAALVLGSLHGEMDKSSSYFSNQMPRTISTKPTYSVRFWTERGLRPPVRNVFEILRDRARFRYFSERPAGDAKIWNIDMRALPTRVAERSVNLVVTSPPYLDVTNFEEDQWLRLWFLGGPPHPVTKRLSKDDRHYWSGSYWSFIGDMWRVLGHSVRRRGHVVVRLGSRRVDPDDLIRQVQASAVLTGRKVSLIESSVSALLRRQTDAFRPGTTGCLHEVDVCVRLD